MKKRILCLVLCFVVTLSCACSKVPTVKDSSKPQEQKEELFNYEVTDEPFESMEIITSLTDYKTSETEQALYDSADMVFIGMPLETFTDGKERYYDVNMNELDQIKGSTYRYTVRDIKVIEMIKGDKSLDTVSVADRAVTIDRSGKKVIAGLASADSIAKKNVKYIYYLINALPDSMDFYFIDYDSGLINIDGLDSDVGRADRVLEAKERLPEQFKKYDRSAELTAK